MTKSNRGGARPGAGRKPNPNGRLMPITIYLTPEGIKARQTARENKLDVNAMVDAFLRRNFASSE